MIRGKRGIDTVNYQKIPERVCKMIREWYRQIIQDMDATDAGSRRMKEEILILLKEEEESLSRQEYEHYRDKAFLVASAAEENGFERGVKYAFRLFVECFRD